MHCPGWEAINEEDSLINAHKRMSDETLDELLGHGGAL